MEPYPLSENSEYHKQAWKLSYLTISFFVSATLLVLIFIPQAPIKLTPAQGIGQFVYYAGILTLFFFGIFTPKELVDAKFLHLLSVFFIWSMPTFLIGELIIHAVKSPTGLSSFFENFDYKFVGISLAYFNQIVGFVCAIGLRVLINYIRGVTRKRKKIVIKEKGNEDSE